MAVYAVTFGPLGKTWGNRIGESVVRIAYTREGGDGTGSVENAYRMYGDALLSIHGREEDARSAALRGVLWAPISTDSKARLESWRLSGFEGPAPEVTP